MSNHIFALVLISLILLCMVLFVPFKNMRRSRRSSGGALASQRGSQRHTRPRRSSSGKLQLETERHECKFWFVNAQQLLESNDRSLPTFETFEREGFQTQHTITREGVSR